MTDTFAGKGDCEEAWNYVEFLKTKVTEAVNTILQVWYDDMMASREQHSGYAGYDGFDDHGEITHSGDTLWCKITTKSGRFGRNPGGDHETGEGHDDDDDGDDDGFYDGDDDGDDDVFYDGDDAGDKSKQKHTPRY